MTRLRSETWLSVSVTALALLVAQACAPAADDGRAPLITAGGDGSGGAAAGLGAAGGGMASGAGGVAVAGGAVGVGGVSGAGSGGGAAGSATSAGTSSSVVDPGTEGDGVFQLEGPYPAAPEMKRMAGVPEGKVIRFTIASSVIYPQAPEREIAVYVPKQYQKGTPAPVMLFQDGTDFYGFDSMLPPLFDNLIEKGEVPAIVGIFVGNGGGDSVGSQRGLEYDTVSGLYAEWADKELLPAVEAATLMQLPEQAVTVTKDPEGRATMGGSSGGAGSFSMVWWRPDLFRRVITFSGTYVQQVPKESPFPHGAWIYHDIDPYDAAKPNGLIAASCESSAGPKTTGAVEPCDTPLSESACTALSGCRWNTSANKPIRVWLQAGSNDNGASGSPGGYRNFHLANQRMAQALQTRGYHVHFDDCEGAGHVDQGPLRMSLPNGLRWLWRGYVGGI